MSSTGYILAGGKSSRFGSDKARAVLDGVPLVVRVAETLGRSCNSVIAVADVTDKYADLGVATIADLRLGLGPIGGLETALVHRLASHGAGWILLTSCDAAGIGSDFSDRIVAQIPFEAGSKAVRAIAFRGDFWQPFPAAFHTDLLPLASALLDEGNASFQRLLANPNSMVRDVTTPPDWPKTPQVNTPEDLERLISRT